MVKDYVITTHSKSLFNISQSPGWTKGENNVLHLALMKFGVGRWTQMIACGVLPGKTITQLNLQTQRLLGQQSIGGFMNMRIDPYAVRKDNEERLERESDRLTVKAGLIINAGANPTREMRQRQAAEHRQRYGLSEEEVQERVSDFDLYSVKRARRIKCVERLQEHFDAQSQKNEEPEEVTSISDHELNKCIRQLTNKLKDLKHMLFSGKYDEDAIQKMLEGQAEAAAAAADDDAVNIDELLAVDGETSSSCGEISDHNPTQSNNGPSKRKKKISQRQRRQRGGGGGPRPSAISNQSTKKSRNVSNSPSNDDPEWRASSEPSPSISKRRHQPQRRAATRKGTSAGISLFDYAEFADDPDRENKAMWGEEYSSSNDEEDGSADREGRAPMQKRRRMEATSNDTKRERERERETLSDSKPNNAVIGPPPTKRLRLLKHTD